MADFGLVGLALTTLLFLAWAMAALSATGLLPRSLVHASSDELPPRRDWDAGRIALVAVLLVPLVFGVQSLLDWTWFIPANAVMALLAAGYLAGRGPLGSEPPGPALKFSRRPARPRVVAALITVATAVLLAWAIWQPEASDRATNDALALADERKFDAAIARTEDAEDLNPLTPDPLLVRASIDTSANRIPDAQRSLERAVIRFPGDPQTWYRLAAFELGTLDAPEQALETIRGVLYLDPHSRPARELFLNARARLREKTGLADPGISE
jgi:tetratricopeptide (TPR) repeat protein